MILFGLEKYFLYKQVLALVSYQNKVTRVRQNNSYMLPRLANHKKSLSVLLCKCKFRFLPSGAIEVTDSLAI